MSGAWGFKGEGNRALEFPAGDNVSVSPPGRARFRYNKSTNQIEQSLAGAAYVPIGGGGGGGGWTDDGGTVRLTTSADVVSIGWPTTVGSEKLRVVGETRLDGPLTQTGLGLVTLAGNVIANVFDHAGIITIGKATATAVVIGRAGQLTTIAGDFSVLGSETIQGTSTFAQDASFDGNLTFGDGAGDTVDFKGQGGVTATGNPTWNFGTGQADFDGNLDANAGLDVTGTTNLTGILSQSGGQVTLAGNVDATNGLDVTGATNLTGTLVQGSGQVTLGGNVDATNGLDVTGVLTVGGIPIIQSGQALLLGGTAVNAAPAMVSLTTLERDALTPVNGMQIYNETLNVMEMYVNGSWQTVAAGGGGGSGWTAAAGIVRLTTVTDDVAIGAAAMVGAEKLRVAGAALIEGDLDVTTGELTFTGTDITLDPTGSFELSMESGEQVTVTISDNKSQSFRLKEDGINYFIVSTVNGSEYIELGNTANNPDLKVLGTGQITFSGDLDVGSIDHAGATLSIGTVATNSVDISRAGQMTTIAGNLTVVGNVDAAVIDRVGAGSIAIGNTNATSVVIGRPTFTTTIAGNLAVSGNETIQGTSQFVQDATFQGNVTIGNDPTDTANFGGGAVTATSNPTWNFGTGQADFDGNVDANAGLDVTGTTNLTGVVAQSGGQVDFGGNVDANAGLDVIGTTNLGGILSQAGGQVTLGGNVDATNGLDVTGGAFTFGGTNINLAPTGTFDLAMNAGQAINVSMADNLASAFVLDDGTNSLLTIDTSGGTELIKFGNAVENPNTHFLGTGTVSLQGTGQKLELAADGFIGIDERGIDPSTNPNEGAIYTKDDGTGITQLYYRVNTNGSVYKLTPVLAPSGWTGGVGLVRLTTLTDDVAIGAAAMVGAERLRVAGAVLFEGALTQTTGQVTLGGNVDATAGLDVSGGALTFTGTAGSWTVAQADSALTQTGSGQVTMTGNVDATAGLDVTGTLTIGGIAITQSGDALLLGGTGTTDAPSFVSLTTTERDALTPVNGMQIYNETLSLMQIYTAGSWSDVAQGGGSGWTDTGTRVQLTTTADTVSIGATAMAGSEKLRVVGHVSIGSGRLLFEYQAADTQIAKGAAPVDTVGGALKMFSGTGGNASAGAAGVGGSLQIEAGLGGDGLAGTPAAAGGSALVIGGWGGVDNGGGSANGGPAGVRGGQAQSNGSGGVGTVSGGLGAGTGDGGDAYVYGGSAPGAGTHGEVHIGTVQTSQVNIAANTITTFIGDNIEIQNTGRINWTYTAGDKQVYPLTAPVDTVGCALKLFGGGGGNASAGAAGVGGSLRIEGGLGGDGLAGTPAAAGGSALVIGGWGGVDNGGGSANGGPAGVRGGQAQSNGSGGPGSVSGGLGAGTGDGGDAYVYGGSAPGAGTHGEVHIGTAQTSQVNIAANTITTFVGHDIEIQNGGRVRWAYAAGNRELYPRIAPNDTIGTNLFVYGGLGGNASASAGGAGGALTAEAGVGGDGAASLTAGAGGTMTVRGGFAGTDNGGGGANGGNVRVIGGPASGGGAGGSALLTGGAGAGNGGGGVVSITGGAANAVGTGAGGGVTIDAGAPGATNVKGTVGIGQTNALSVNIAANTITTFVGHDIEIQNTGRIGWTYAAGAREIYPLIAPNDTIGSNLNLYGGPGGIASASAGGAGGGVLVEGGVGGDGTASLVAGAGGTITVRGGFAGTDNGGGGANGGPALVIGGPASGGGAGGGAQVQGGAGLTGGNAYVRGGAGGTQNGDVLVGDINTRRVEIAGAPTVQTGFFGAAGVVQGTIAGAKLAGDVVMANLLTYLASLGILVDATT